MPPPPPRREQPAPAPEPQDPACEGRRPLERGACRRNTDCLYGCAAESARTQYGDCSCPQAGWVCRKVFGGAYAGARERCAPGCAQTGCREGDRCGADGRCAPQGCGEGHACDPGARCESGAPGADLHGCVPATCQADPDCPCPTYCVLGRCQARTGVCVQPAA